MTVVFVVFVVFVAFAGLYSSILTNGAAVTFLTNSIVSAMIWTSGLLFEGLVAFGAGRSVIEGLKSVETGDMYPLYNKMRLSVKVFWSDIKVVTGNPGDNSSKYSTCVLVKQLELPTHPGVVA